MDPYTATLNAITAIAKLLDELTQERILIASNLAAADRQKWAEDQQKLAQPWIDLAVKLTPHVG